MANAERERGSYQDWGSRPNLMSDVSVFPHHHRPHLLHTSSVFFTKCFNCSFYLFLLFNVWKSTNPNLSTMNKTCKIEKKKCNIHIFPRLSRLCNLIQLNVSVRLKLHSAGLVLHMHVITIQMWMCGPLFSLLHPWNCLFFHHCARFLFPFFLLFSHNGFHILSYIYWLSSSFFRPPPRLRSLSGWTDSFQVFDASGKCLRHRTPFSPSFLWFSTSSSSLLLCFPHVFCHQCHNVVFIFLPLSFFFLMDISSVQQENCASGRIFVNRPTMTNCLNRCDMWQRGFKLIKGFKTHSSSVHIAFNLSAGCRYCKETISLSSAIKAAPERREKKPETCTDASPTLLPFPVIVILFVMRKRYQKDSLANMKNSGEIHEQLVTYDEEGGGEMDTNGYVWVQKCEMPVVVFAFVKCIKTKKWLVGDFLITSKSMITSWRLGNLQNLTAFLFSRGKISWLREQLWAAVMKYNFSDCGICSARCISQFADPDQRHQTVIWV